MSSCARGDGMWTMVLGAFLVGCGGGVPAVERTFTASQLDSLPRTTVSDGPRVCEATGYDPCPLRRAVANWLGPDRYALWEPGNLVRLYDGHDSAGRVVGAVGHGAGSYGFATAVGPDRGGIAVIDGARNTLVRFDVRGRAAGEVLLPRHEVDDAPGFDGAVPVLQRARSQGAGGSAILEVQVLKAATDSSGKVMLSLPLPWLVLSGGKPVQPTPFFPAVPRYAVDADHSIVWSPGDRFEIHRRSQAGANLWTLASDRTGPPVTPEDIAGRRREVESQTDPHEVPPSDVDSMIARTGKLHPAIGGITIAPSGAILVSGPQTPSRDSVDYFVLTSAGVPITRFTLPSRMQVLLFGGDSLLVHQPTESEPWEVRWMQLRMQK